MDKLQEVKEGFLPGLVRRTTPKGLQKTPSGHQKPKSVMDILPDSVRNNFIAMAGEFVGTFLFLFFAFSGTQVANTPTSNKNTSSTPATTNIVQGPNAAALLYIALAFGFSLAVNAWVFFRISGGLFNPAVSFIVNQSTSDADI